MYSSESVPLSCVRGIKVISSKYVMFVQLAIVDTETLLIFSKKKDIRQTILCPLSTSTTVCEVNYQLMYATEVAYNRSP